jgi:hypothetical protein
MSSMTQLDAYRLLQEGAEALSFVEEAGFRIDLEYCQEKLKWIDHKLQQAELRLKRSELGRAWQARYGSAWKHTSQPQLKHILYQDMRVKAYKQSGEESTDEESLLQTGVDGAQHVLTLRRFKKARDVIYSLIRYSIEGRILPSYLLHTVQTYRSSCAEPNLQNVPKRDKEIMDICRRAFIPSHGHRLMEIDFSGIEVGIAACVTGDTVIETVGKRLTVLQLIDQLNCGNKVYVYGYNQVKGRIAISEVVDAGLTRRKAEVWQVTLDNGKTIKATPDHEFMLRDGTFIPLRLLKSGMSLMPLYKKTAGKKQGKTYRDVYLNNGQHMLEHNLIALDVLGIEIKGSGLLVHHLDSNGCNNQLNNLEVMTRRQHMKIHSIQGWKNNRKGHLDNHWMRTEEGKAFITELNRRRALELTVDQKAEFGRRTSEGIKRKGGRIGELNSMYGRSQTEQAKQKISNSKKGRTSSWIKGKTKYNDPRVAEIGRKTSISKRGNTVAWNKGLKGLYITSDSTKLKLSAAGKDRHWRDSSKRLISEKALIRWANTSRKNTPCKLCGKLFTTVTNTHLKHSHGMSIDEYKSLTSNHLVSNVEFYGYEDVFNLNVDVFHNYAVGAGVVIKNCYHKDPVMLKYLNDPSSDMHSDMAQEIFILPRLNQSLKKLDGGDTLRQSAKNGFVFPQFYGDYFVACAFNIACSWCKLPQSGVWEPDQGIVFNGKPIVQHLLEKDIDSLDVFTSHMEKVEKNFWNRRFKVYNEWRKSWYGEYQKTGEFEMKTGFKVSGLLHKNQVINYPVQGSAFHCLLKSLIEMVSRMKGWKSKVIGEIHDSMIIDAHPSEIDDICALAQKICTEELPADWPWIIVPMRVEIAASEIDGNWSEMKVLH